MLKRVGLIGFGILTGVILFSGCSNKPDLKHWSKTTAAYLISQKYPKVVNSKKRVSVFSAGPFGMAIPSGHKIIDNYNIGVMKFGKIISCNSNRTTHTALCWYTVIFVPNKTYYKVRKKLAKHLVINKTGEAESFFQQTVNKNWYVYVVDWQWRKTIVQWRSNY